jgi:hypothetical protein
MTSCKSLSFSLEALRRRALSGKAAAALREERERERDEPKRKRTVLHTENSYSPTGSCERTLIVSVFSFAADIFLFYLSRGFFFFAVFLLSERRRGQKIKRAFFSVFCRLS